MRFKRALVAGILAASVMTWTTAPATAAPTVHPAQATWEYPAAQVKWHWWGSTVQFNGNVTRLIASGAGAAAGKAVANVSGVGGWAIVVGLGVFQEAASQAVESGKCLAITGPYGGSGIAWPETWDCGEVLG